MGYVSVNTTCSSYNHIINRLLSSDSTFNENKKGYVGIMIYAINVSYHNLSRINYD